MVGGFKKGKVNEVRTVTTGPQFLTDYGTPLRGDLGVAAHAALYFLRWGHILKVMRVADDDVEFSTVNLFSTTADSAGSDSTGTETVIGTIDGVTEGDWADGLQVVITSHQVPTVADPTIPETVFILSVYSAGSVLLDSNEDFVFNGSAPLEIWQDVVFSDPTHTRFVEKVVNGNSQFITVTMTLNEDPDIFHVYELDGGNDGTTAIGASEIIGGYDPLTQKTSGLEAFSDPKVIEINLLSAPGFNHDRVVANHIGTVCQQRFDALGIIDTPDLKNGQDMADYVQGNLGSPGNPYAAFAPLESSNRFAIFGPWINIFDSYNRESIWVPPSTRVCGQFAFNDSVSYPWYATAGANRGVLFDTQDVRFKMSLGEGEIIYGFGVNINPIITSIDGVIINGNKNLQRKPSLLQNIHIVRMLMYAERVIANAVRYLQWEPHDPVTWRRYVNLVQPFLSDIATKRGITDFRVRCDSTTNTPFNINLGQLVAEIYIIPTNAVQVIVNRYIIEPNGVTLDSQQTLNVGSQINTL